MNADGGFGRRFWTLWSAFSASNLGDGLALVGFPLFAVSITDDARLVGLVAAAQFLPFLVVGLPAGVIIDRFDRRKLAMFSQVLRSAALLFVGFAALADSATIPLLAACAFVVGVGEVLTDGGLPAVVRDVVTQSQLEDANARLRASETVSNQFIGPPVGALLFQFSSAAPFLLAAGLYIAAVGFLAALTGSYRPEQSDDPGSFISQMGTGLSYVWNHSVLRPLAFAVGLYALVGSAHHSMGVVLITERLGLSEVQYGLLLAVDAIAAVVMSFFVSRLVKRTSHGFSMKVSVVTFALHAFIFGFSVFVPLIVLGFLIGGIADPTWNVVSATVRQRLVDDEIFGRMMTAYLFIAWSMQPLGPILGGVITETWGVEWVYIMSGTCVASLLVFARPLFAKIDAAMQSIS